MSEGQIYLEGGYQKAFEQKVTGVDGTGVVFDFSLEHPLSNWLLQVYGEVSTPDAWNVTLAGGYDLDKVGTLLTHDSTMDDEGDLKTVSGVPVKALQVSVNSLTLGGAAAITIVVMGMRT